MGYHGDYEGGVAVISTAYLERFAANAEITYQDGISTTAVAFLGVDKGEVD